MNYNEYQALREQNVQLFLGDNPKFKICDACRC